MLPEHIALGVRQAVISFYINGLVCRARDEFYREMFRGEFMRISSRVKIVGPFVTAITGIPAMTTIFLHRDRAMEFALTGRAF